MYYVAQFVIDILELQSRWVWIPITIHQYMFRKRTSTIEGTQLHFVLLQFFFSQDVKIMLALCRWKRLNSLVYMETALPTQKVTR